jgi:hypothetical protein
MLWRHNVCRLKYRSSIRLKRNAKRNILTLAGANDALNIRLIHVGGAPGHMFPSKFVGKFVPKNYISLRSGLARSKFKSSGFFTYARRYRGISHSRSAGVCAGKRRSTKLPTWLD